MVPVGEDGVGLDELLGEVVVEALEQVGALGGRRWWKGRRDRKEGGTVS